MGSFGKHFSKSFANITDPVNKSKIVDTNIYVFPTDECKIMKIMKVKLSL